MRFSQITQAGTGRVPLSTGVAVVAVLILAPLFGRALANENWLILAALGMVALVPVVIRWPIVATFGFYALFVSSFDGVSLLPGGATLSRPIGILTAAVLLAAGLMERRLHRPPAAALWWGLFILLGALSAAWALDPEAALGRLRMALNLFLLYIVAVSIRPTRKELYWVCVLTVVGGVVAATLGYVYGLEDGGAAGRGRIVIGDQETNPNWLGRTLILPLALALAGLVMLRGAVPRAMALGCIGIIGLGIYISMSRGALVAMILMLGVFFYRMRARREVVAVVAAAIVLLVIASTMLPSRFYERTGAVVTGEDATGAGRTERWTVGLQSLEEFWAFGAGLGNFSEAYKQYAGPWGLTAHNVYLTAAVEMGILGLALLLAAIGSHLLAARAARNVGYEGVVLGALEAACVGALASAFFADIIWTKGFWLSWTLLVWATSCSDGRQSVGMPEALPPTDGLGAPWPETVAQR